MRTSTLASLLFSGLALAGPVRKRDDIVTDVIVETVWTTTTIYVDGPTDAAFFEVAASTASSSSVSSSAVPTSSAAPSSSAAPPPPSASPPAPSPAPQLKVAEAPKPVVAAPQVKQAAAPAAPAAGTMTGEGTWYDVSVGLGSCGKSASNSQPVVALAAAYMKNGVNPNANPLCGKTINLIYGGKTTTAIVHDTCPECAVGDVDLSPELFKTVFPNGDGRVAGLQWYLS